MFSSPPHRTIPPSLPISYLVIPAPSLSSFPRKREPRGRGRAPFTAIPSVAEESKALAQPQPPPGHQSLPHRPSSFRPHQPRHSRERGNPGAGSLQFTTSRKPAVELPPVTEPDQNRHVAIHYKTQAVTPYPDAVMALPARQFDHVTDLGDVGRCFQLLDYPLYPAAQISIPYSSKVAVEATMIPNPHPGRAASP